MKGVTMNPRNFLILFILGVVLWLAAQGRLANVVYAMENDVAGDANPPSDGTGTAPGGGAAAGGDNKPWPASWPNPAGFGLKGVGSYYDYIAQGSSQAIKNEDTAGLVAAGSKGPAVHDWDYGLSHNEGVRTPAGSRWTLVHIDKPGANPWNGAEVFRTEAGGYVEYMHLSQVVSDSLVGKTLPGRTAVGVTGEPLSPSNGYGKQLSVIVDAQGAKDLLSYGI